MLSWLLFFFFFQAEDGIRDLYVTGVQTCALPISVASGCSLADPLAKRRQAIDDGKQRIAEIDARLGQIADDRKTLEGQADSAEKTEIGRASCRERVEIGEVGESIKKKSRNIEREQ